MAQPDAEARLKATRLVAIVLGSVEQDDPHTCLCTDAFAANAIAEAVAQQLKQAFTR